MDDKASTDGHSARPALRVAAMADLHCDAQTAPEVREKLAAAAGASDLLLLAGDLTTCGEPEQSAALAEACAGLPVPVVAVLGNHDWHAGRCEEVLGTLREGGVRVLQGEALCIHLAGMDVGVVGAKGFVGGFSDHSHIADFGEPALRELYRLTSLEVQALERGLHEVELCAVRIVLLHYAPTSQTLVGEPDGIWSLLGSDRLAAPILEHEPDLVVHGHAHAGSLKGAIGSSPVYNVSLPVLEGDCEIFELHPRERTAATLH